MSTNRVWLSLAARKHTDPAPLDSDSKRRSLRDDKEEVSHIRHTTVNALRPRIVASLIALCFCGAAESSEQRRERVILISWDGAGYGLTSKMLDQGKVPNLARMIEQGAWADGMISSFPTKTAPAHAMLWTGRHGHQSGITGNLVLRLPKNAYDWLETRDGYRSHPLRADTIWEKASRLGLTSYVVNATQTYPADRFYESPTIGAVHILNGYTDIVHPAELVSHRSTGLSGSVLDWIPEAAMPSSLHFEFRVADDVFWGLFFDDPLDERYGWDTFGIGRREEARFFETRLKLDPSRHQWTEPISARSGEARVWFELLLLDWSEAGRQFEMLRSGAADVNLSPGFPGGESMRVFSGNSATALYRDGGLGQTRISGGGGAAEVVALSSVDRLTAQIEWQAQKVLSQGDYDLAVFYSPGIDEYSHTWLGYLDPTADGYDKALADHLWEALSVVYGLQDRLLGRVLEQAKTDGAHVFLVSDHGMAATDKRFHVNVALQRAGLLEWESDGTIDLSRSRAFMPPLSDLSIVVNTDERPRGIVPAGDLDAVILEVRRALATVLDDSTDGPVVVRTFEPSTSGLLQPGGDSTGHLFVDLAPGYYPSADFDEGMVSHAPPEGNHIFVPTRPDMLAICAGWGPRISAGTRWPRVRGIDVAPTILHLLSVPADDLPGRSLLGPETILAR